MTSNLTDLTEEIVNSVERLKILACAYTCSPTGEGEKFGGGEDILGWNVVKQLSRFHTVWVLSHSRNKSSVEARMYEVPDSNLHFHFFELYKWFRPLQNFQGGIQLYAFLWQVTALVQAFTLYRIHRFKIFHHITYANDWMASYVGAVLPMAYIRGPCGGAHRTPKKYLSEYGFLGIVWEYVRSIGQWIFRHDPFFIISQFRCKAILVCNSEAYHALPVKFRAKSHLFAVCGVSTYDLALHPEQAKTSQGCFRIISAGKLLRLKGFGMAIQAFADFASKHSNTRFKIVGDGPDLQRLKSLASVYGVEELVEFTQWLSREELLEEMYQSEVFLFPSLRDGGGAVVIEAMSMGKPVVCLDVSGPAMHVTEETGIKIRPTCPVDSVKLMAEALEKLYFEPNLRSNMGKLARERAEQVYHWDKVGDRINDIYTTIAKFETRNH